jgi:predicted glycoside hydrolase/deacetylase ChbG (UPF0249 family)
VPATKRLIINADGFGFGPGATQGIFDALREGGVITSVSVNANFPDAERLGDLVTEFPHLSVGVHLNPVVGRPCLSPDQVPSLVGRDASFHHTNFARLLRRGMINLKELAAELDMQIRRVKELAGDKVTHIDSQCNGHLEYFDLFLSLAKKWSFARIRTNASLICLEAPVPRVSRSSVYIRKPHVWLVHQYRKWQMKRARARDLRMADHLITVGYAGTGGKANPENWFRIMRNLPVGTYEMYCHPAYPESTLRRWSYYCDERGRELDILRKGDLRQAARDQQVSLIGFSDI